MVYEDRAWDREVTIFGPGENKRPIFDLHMIDESGVPAGRDTVRGAYGGQWTAPLP